MIYELGRVGRFSRGSRGEWWFNAGIAPKIPMK